MLLRAAAYPFFQLVSARRFSFLNRIKFFIVAVISKHSFLEESTNIFEVGEGIMTVLPMIEPDGKTVVQLLEETRNVMMQELLL